MHIKRNKRTIHAFASTTALGCSVLFAAAVNAENAVTIKNFGDGGDMSNHIMTVGDSISASGFGLNNSYSDNALLNNSAWGHTGDWYTFMTHDIANVTVNVSADIADTFAPGVTLWTTGSSAFDGGTTDSSIVSTAGFGLPDSFNAVGSMGDLGTSWMAASGGGNAIETLGYAVAGPTHLAETTGWGEDIHTGVHDVSLTDIFESGVSGSTGSDFASLTFNGLEDGWYALYVGGTDASMSGGLYTLDVITAPVPEAEVWAMMLAGMGLLGWRMKKQQHNSKRLVA